MHVHPKGKTDCYFQTGVVHLVEEVLHRPRHVTDVRRRPEDDPVGFEDVGRPSGQGCPYLNGNTFDLGVVCSLRTASSISCTAGDGVCWTTSRRRGISPSCRVNALTP